LVIKYGSYFKLFDYYEMPPLLTTLLLN